ncbi:uncharacterized protein LOC129101833 [Anoplopoma fimbria]|uniref:uncharacterized protein LOC129101833 n=1 Tax=Anoplopoma fimbria TaxID=229290 RepID=UPI0023EB1C4D|nr:uncharacterized protein LOC129101833 [Anoplopoma fimbria]
MPLCLYECLRAVGLQSYYARFTSLGVHRAAHLSVLTMEDYPILGIRSMEERTRLFHLVQMVKTLDLEYENEYANHDADGGNEGYPGAESSFTYDGCVDPDDDVCDDDDEKGAAHRFYFDQVFGEESSNEEVYRRTAYPLVQHMLNGGKATCFAYGQTGAGKTHTMLGSPVRPGLYALAVLDIFAYLSTTHMHSPLLVYVSFFEIYCGQLYDLLDHRKRLFAREDGQNVVHIVGLRDVRVDSVSSLLEVISRGTEERTQGMSGVNPLSSRSHALLQIQLRDTNQKIAGRMWFVDLAGSERASDTKEPDRQSRMEGAEINQSLLALKECIRSLDQGSHTPFRQSKLTQVLKDSFVGDSMTCMIANISPGHLATEHTLNTLRYADRVKELRGQVGLRGGRRGKTMHSPKRNLSNSSSSSSSGRNMVGTRGKSPPKKPKLERHFGLNIPTSRFTTRGSILCSTPKNSRWGEETSPSTRYGIGLEQITPVRGLLGKGDMSERTGGREGRRRERYGVTDSAGHSDGDRQIMAGLVIGQATDEQILLREVQKESGFTHGEKENQQSTLKGGRKEERRQIEQGRQVVSSRDTCSDVERLSVRDIQKDDERNKEQERHLRQYHQQLQQFMPSSASSSVHLSSPSTCPSYSSSNQASLSFSVPPSSSSSFQHSSRFSVSNRIYHGLEEVLDAYRANVEVRAACNNKQLSFFPSGEICLQAETSPSYSKNKDEVGHGGSDGAGEKWRVSREATEAIFGQDGGKHEKRSQKGTGEGEVRVRRREWKPAGTEGRRERRWATTTETERANRMTGAMPADVEALVVYNCDSEESREEGGEEINPSDVPTDGVWSTEEREGADGYGLLSTHSSIDSNILFNHPPAESSHQRAPAERPLSPACGLTNALLTPNKLSDLSLKFKHCRCPSNIVPLPIQNAQHGGPSSSYREEQPRFAAHANRTDFSNSQSATVPLTTPITRSGCNISAEPLNILSESPAYTRVHNHPEVKAKRSGLPQEVTADSLSYIMDPISISLLQVDQRTATASFLQGEQKSTSLCPLETERGEDNRREGEKERLTYDYCGKGMMKPPIPEVMLVSRQDQENNQKPQTTPAIAVLGYIPPASALKTSTCGPTKSNRQESANNQKIINLSTLEDLDHRQCCVVQAHWEQLEEMEALCLKEGTLLCQQPDMAFEEYVHKLEDIMERKARCIQSMIAHLQPYLKPNPSNQQQDREEDNQDLN